MEGKEWLGRNFAQQIFTFENYKLHKLLLIDKISNSTKGKCLETIMDNIQTNICV